MTKHASTMDISCKDLQVPVPPDKQLGLVHTACTGPQFQRIRAADNLADAFCKDTDSTEAQPYPVDLFIKAAQDLSGSRLQQKF